VLFQFIDISVAEFDITIEEKLTCSTSSEFPVVAAAARLESLP
jgi:hypothetical protein